MWYEYVSEALQAYHTLDVQRCTELSDPTGELAMALMAVD